MNTATTSVPRFQDFQELAEFEQVARTAWSPAAEAFISGVAGEGRGELANRTALDRWALRSRVLRDVSSIDTSTTVLGKQVSTPVLLAPSGLHILSTPEAEVATGIACRAAGSLMVLSSGTTRSVGEVAGTGAPLWMQLYWGADRERLLGVVRQAEEAGCLALCLTVDMPVRPVRNRSVREGILGVAHHESAYLPSRASHLGNAPWDHDATLTWRDLAWLRSETSLPIVLKGVMSGEDARLAAENGVAGIIVSNHGGRALDTRRGTADALVEIVDALEGSPLEVYLDGGIRSGTDVCVALALGARAVLIGRPVHWGLATGGSNGLAALMQLMREQLLSVMGMAGVRSVTELKREHLADASPTNGNGRSW